MKHISIFYIILLTLILTNCNWLRIVDEEYISMLITSSHLKLYSNNTFSNESASDIVMPDGSTETMISTGVYERLKDGIVLKYDGRNIIDTLFYVSWGKKKFLLDEFAIIYMCNGINLGTINYTDYNGLSVYWTNAESINIDVEGKPTLPPQYSSFIFKDSLSANITGIDEDSLRISINKGEQNDLFVGCELTNGNLSFIVKELNNNSAIVIPKDYFYEIYFHTNNGNYNSPLKSIAHYKGGIDNLKVGELLHATN